MSLSDAIHELRDRVNELHGWLSALTDGAARAGGGTAHHLIDRVDRAALELAHRLHPVQAAVWRAARPGASSADVFSALADAQRALDRLRQKPARGLWSRALGEHLADLFRRHAGTTEGAECALGAWAEAALPLVLSARAAVPSARAALAACWRELVEGAHAEPAARAE